MSAWTPASYVVDGVFATYDDLRGATQRLAELTGSSAIVATCSTRFLLPSTSWADGEDAAWGERTIERLRIAVPAALTEAEQPLEVVETLVLDELRAAGLTDPVALCFGNPERSGRLAVIVAAGPSLRQPEAAEHAALCAACALGSRPAAFSRDTAIDGWFRLATHVALEEAPFASRATGDLRTVQGLATFAREALGASWVAVYEGDEIHPHRSTVLELCARAPAEELPAWMPDHVELPASAEVPPPPELGGSRFAELGELAAICGVTNRRLFGVVAGDSQVFGLPYGYDRRKRRAIGVLCVVWDLHAERRSGVYEMAVTRMVALHLARDHDERRRQDSVKLVTSQLAFISALQTTPGEKRQLRCAQALAQRQDVQLVASPVSATLRGLVHLSGAMSATCRLISGAEGAPLSRHLLRLHCEGHAPADASPDAIALEDAAQSVNAWVATHGEMVHLRDLEPDVIAGYWTSPDLSRYPGLDRVSIYREDVSAELCVPIYAEGRIVGTVNLEADDRTTFDATAQIVPEYAQLIGIALLEARRRISVDTVSEAGGFLDHRHVLETALLELKASVRSDRRLSGYRRRKYQATLRGLLNAVFMRRIPEHTGLADGVTVAEVLHAAMASINFVDTDRDISELTLDYGPLACSVLASPLPHGSAEALQFAVRQALHNVLKHGAGGDSATGRRHLAMFRFALQTLGGTPNAYVAVSSTCSTEVLRGLDPQRVFREPIEHEGQKRVSLGTYLAGESVRHCGGSAYFRVYPYGDDVAIVDAEFSVPTF